MSLAGRAATRGSRITIYRPTEVETGDLGRKVQAWTVIAADLPAIIEGETDERMQKVFGTEPVVKDRLYLPGLKDVQPGDAIRSTAGKRAGERWRVRVVLPFDQSGRPHKEAALESTQEAVGVPCELGGLADGTCVLSGRCGCRLAPNADCLLAG